MPDAYTFGHKGVFPYAVSAKNHTAADDRAAAPAFTGALIAFLIPAVRYFRTLTGAMAVSNASDLITQTVSNIVENEMRLLGPDGVKFVSFEKDGDGQISAIVTDTSRVNILSAELLNAIVEASDRGDLDLSIPFGNLLGISFFLGRGPTVPV